MLQIVVLHTMADERVTHVNYYPSIYTGDSKNIDIYVTLVNANISVPEIPTLLPYVDVAE